MKRYLKFIYHLYATLVGLLFGIFIGLLLFSALFRIVLDFLFEYGDSGPPWVSWIIVLLTSVVSGSCIWVSNKWMVSYIERKKIKASRKTKSIVINIDENENS